MLNIIVLSWNTVDLTSKCLSAVFENTSVDFWLTVWDNGSQDESVSHIRKMATERGWDNLELIEHPENIGYTKAINRCLTHLMVTNKMGDYTVLLNSDAFVTSGWDTAMLSCMESADDIGIVCGKLLSDKGDGKIDNAGDALIPPVPLDSSMEIWNGDVFVNEPFILCPYYTRSRTGYEGRNDWSRREDIDMACFAFACLKTKMIREIGMLNERFVIYFSDSEYCLRAKSNGWRIVYEPLCRIIHMGSEPTKRRFRAGDTKLDKMIESDMLSIREMYSLALPFLWHKFGTTPLSV